MRTLIAILSLVLLVLTVPITAGADYTVVTSGASAWTENWSSLDGWYNNNFAPLTDVTVGTDPAMGRVLHVTSTASSVGYPMRSRQHWNKDKPITVTATVRGRESPGGQRLPWMGINLYSSEAEYWGMCWDDSGTGEFAWYANAYWSFYEEYAEDGVVYTYLIDYDPARYPTTFFYKNGLQVGARDWKPTVHPSLWIGTVLYNDTGDYGAVTVVGEPVFASNDSGNSGSWDLTNVSHEGGTELVDASDKGVYHFYSFAGGLTIRNSANTDIKWPSGGDIGYLGGSFRAKSPTVTVSAGSKFSKLRLVGSVRSGGTLKVQLRQTSGALIPDTQLPGNSTGFTPTYGSVMTVDLSNVSDSALYVDIQGSSPSDTTTAAASTRTPDVGPPILKSISIEAALGGTVTPTGATYRATMRASFR